MSHQKKAHQKKIQELKNIERELAGTGLSTKEIDQALKGRNFGAAKSLIRRLRELFIHSGHGGGFRENNLNENQNKSADSFLKDTEKFKDYGSRY